MATLKDFRNERLRKLETLKSLGVDPYPSSAKSTHSIKDLIDKFDDLVGVEAQIVGRIKSIRKFGKLAFLVIKSADYSIQLFIKTPSERVDPDRNNSELSIPDELPLLDTGDFVEASGKLIKTQTGEISIDVEKLRLLAKSLRPLPSEIEGFTDKEQRLRRRYVDMQVNEDVKNRIIRRSNFWQSTRNFLVSEGFTEINIPVLEHTPGGADATPFVTHMNALDQDFYLRISHELPLKRLLVGGFDKVFDIGPRFRNENYSEEHLPEHVAMEWYWAYADWDKGMNFTERMIRKIADDTWGKRQFSLNGNQKLDLGEDNIPFPRISFVQIMQEKYGINVHDVTLDEAVKVLKEIGGEVEKIDNRTRVIDKLWKKLRTEINGPAFLIDIPTYMQPLAKTQSSDQRLVEQFNLLIGGSEVCKAYSELNNPLSQYQRFIEQQKMRDAGDTEAQMMDIDYIEALEYGMPPACGYGHSERLFWILEGVTAREGVPFPQLRSEIDETTKSIYPELFS